MQAEDCFVHFQDVDLDDVTIIADTEFDCEARLQHPWFFVSIRLTHGAIRIENLTVYDTHEGQGIGSTVVQALLRFADEHQAVLLATNVLPGAVNFWCSRHVGFVSDPHNPDDFLPPHHVTRTEQLTIPW